MAGLTPAWAQTASALRASAGLTTPVVAPVTTRPAAVAPSSAGMVSASARAIATQARVANATSLASQANAAARAAAASLTSNVPNGLVAGGLVPVANPTTVALDPTGLRVWEGASAPVQTGTAAAPVVTITQTQSRALLSWSSFNIGRETQLVFNQQSDWVVLNRIVSNIDPLTGQLADAGNLRPSQILGSITGAGTVLVLNQNGILFGATSQINTHSFLASTLEIGARSQLEATSAGNVTVPTTIADRSTSYLRSGLLLSGELLSSLAVTSGSSVVAGPQLEGAVSVEAGASITAGTGGYVIIAAPTVSNAGQLSATEGQVSLQSGRQIFAQTSSGSADSADPNVRGLLLRSATDGTTTTDQVTNTATGVITATRGYVSLGTSATGTLTTAGVLAATTSVARNGKIALTGAIVDVAPGGVIAVTPDEAGDTIPQGADSVAAFKHSVVTIGAAPEINGAESGDSVTPAVITIGADATIYAPSADVAIGGTPAASGVDLTADRQSLASSVLVDSGAIIDVGGIKDFVVDASRNSIRISPVKRNELRDTPNYREETTDGSFTLNGTTLFVDPRLSGVRDDGVAWIGSPLIEAASYFAQVGVTAGELMTSGGTLTLGARSYVEGSSAVPATVTVKSGATLDVSGGWVTYGAGEVVTSRLLTADGRIVAIGNADPNDNFVALLAPVTATQARYGVSTSYADPTSAGSSIQPSYTEGRDAGALTIKASTNVLAGTIHAEAFAGTHQLADAKAGTATSDLPGDMRALQATATQLPSGGLLKIQAMNQIGSAATSQTVTGGGDIIVYAGSGATPAQGAGEILLSDTMLSGSGFAGLTLQTSGSVTLARGSSLTLAAGGGLQIDAGRTIRFDGDVSVASGSIAARTYELQQGSVFRSDDDLPLFIAATDATPHLFDIDVTGTLSAAGRWVNDALVNDGAYLGGSYTDGGSISLTVAPRVLVGIDSELDSDFSADLSGSIHIKSGARLDVTGGGYVKPDATLVLDGAGGDISLINQTSYFQLAADTFNVSSQSNFIDTNVPSFRTSSAFGRANAAAPRALESVVEIAAGSIAAQGFGAGGSFTLVTPDLNFGAVAGEAGTALAFDFISTSGFADYSLTTWKTRLTPNVFSNGKAGNTALLDTEVVRIDSGQSLLLTQSTINSLLDSNQVGALQALATGGDLIATVGTAVASDAWDQLPVNLTFGGLTELEIAAGGRIDGSDGASLTTAKLLNAGTIRIAGGSVRQSLSLPAAYLDATRPALGVSDLATVFGTPDSDGLFDEDAPNALGITASATATATVMSNADLTTLGGSSRMIYYTGTLAAGEGIRLLAGSVIDLSGTSIRNPRAGAIAGTTTQKVEGRLVGGGSLSTDAAFNGSGIKLFELPGYGETRLIEPVSGAAITVRRSGEQLLADRGATINLAGASDQYDQLVTDGRFALSPVWSDGGQLSLGAGGSLTGATLLADGGAPQALGGTLTWLDPVLQQRDGDEVVRDVVAADQIMAAGFDSFVAQDRLTTLGDVNLSLGRAFYLTARPYDGVAAQAETLRAAIGTTGALAIAAPYVHLESPLQTVVPLRDAADTGSLLFTATTVDVVGSVYFEPSLARVSFNVSGDFRLTGAQSPLLTIVGGNSPVTTTSALAGQLVVSGDLDIRAAQIYPTTGTGSLQQDINAARDGTAQTAKPYLIASTGADATIRFTRSSSSIPDLPWSAGGNLLVQAAHIDQSGVVRVPLGRLQLGSNTDLEIVAQRFSLFVPATQSVDIGSGGITSVSAGGLNIPYGTTTDLIEYYFAPTSDARLFAPPAAELRLSADTVNIDAGATVDLSGGGDVYAYEFVAGVGGSRDVLDRTNSDAFSSNNGLQYADGRQVYAIVPSLADAAVAPFDPIYSSDYANLYAGSDVGRRVYLDAAPGLAAGWYTLLPARYALLPGGMRVVENVGADAAAPGVSATLKDGSVIVGGHYGVSGTSSEESQRRTFTVMSQEVLKKYSRIELTSATTTFKTLAERDKLAVPQLPADAARLVLTPLSDLVIASRFQTDIGSGGRGAQVDVAGNAFEIVAPGTPASGGNAITLTTTDFANLNAASLLIGGTRRDLADGTTVITATAHDILVANNAANPLSAPEIVLVVDGLESRITLADGATLAASGTLLDTRSGAYVINASTDPAAAQTAIGGIVRVANGTERLIDRPGALALANSLSQTDVTIGDATLTGTSILLDSTRDLTITDNALAAGQPLIHATNLALGGDDVFFTTVPSGFRGLTITPDLEAQFAQTERLTITSKSIIGFSAGAHAFNDLVLDARGLRPYGQATGAPLPPEGFTTQTDTLVADTGLPIAVSLTARSLTLLNSDKDRGICSGTYIIACGTTGNTLTIAAQEVHFGSGTIHTYGFDAAVTLTASSGVYAEGTGTFDVGGARLTIDTPYLGERALVADPRGQKLQPSLGLLTSNDFALINSAGTTAAAVAAAPGAQITIGGTSAPVRSVLIDNVALRATAGQIDIRSAGSIIVTGSASLEAPGYAKTFGDAADAVKVSAPGGGVTLVSQAGDIDFGSATRISIGGGSGSAGSLRLSAATGLVRLPATIDAAAPDGAASLTLDTARNPFVSGTSGVRLFDLPTFLAGAGAGFNGVVQIRVGEGDLAIGAGQTLRATQLRLTSDAGAITVAGNIDTSGINGGNIGLYGATGVTLASTAHIDAGADGYDAKDTRSAQGGAVEIGTSPGGRIDIASGAVIDVAAQRPGDRLIETVRKDSETLNDTPSYDYAASDTGGSVLLRAPLVSGNSVDINYAGTIVGASSVAVEAYKIFDLAAMAGGADCSLAADVCINATGQAVLDLGAKPASGVNRLADAGSGSVVDTVVDFVQKFSLAGATGLGTLTVDTAYVARPGIELYYAGDIVLASNWNLGAGIVDEVAARAAGLLVDSPVLGKDLNGKQLAYLVPGSEQEIFNTYTNFLYRVGGKASGAAGVLTLRAGGNLDIGHSITDGFFAFSDQTEPNYVSYQLGGGNRQYRPALSVVCGTFASTAFSCGSLGTPFQTFPGKTAVPYAAADIITISAGTLTEGQDLQYVDGAAAVIAPYSAAANSAAAAGMQTGGAGDAIGSAELFPLLVADAEHPEERAADSFSLRLVGGAAGAGGSADPLRVSPLSTASVTIDGESSYRAAPIKGVSSYSGALQLFNYGYPGAVDLDSATVTDPANFIAAVDGLDGSYYTRLNFGSNVLVANYLRTTSKKFLADNAVAATDYQYFGGTSASPTILTARLDVIVDFLQSISVDFGDKIAHGYFSYAAPTARAATTLANPNVFTRTLVRTGVGSIEIAAALDVDLDGSGAASFRNVNARTVSAGSNAGAQVGGSAVYTAGHRVNPAAVLASVTAGGKKLAVDPSALALGSSSSRSGIPNYQGVLAGEAVYADGGGSIVVSAGRDVLGRRDVWAETFRAGAGLGSSVGSASQLWRVGNVGAADLAVSASAVTNIRINPQLFSTGLGTLAGGNIAVSAGRDIRDVTIAADTSVTTATVGTDGALALVSYGGGNIDVSSGRDLLGGRIDLSSGTASIVAAGDITSAGTLRLAGKFNSSIVTVLDENRLLLRVGNGTAALVAGGSIDVAGIASTGVREATPLGGSGFYTAVSGVSALSNGDFNLFNAGKDIVTGFSAANDSFTNTSGVLLPGSLAVSALFGSIDLAAGDQLPLVLYPSSTGQLALFAGGDIASVTLAMDDGDASLAPGALSAYANGVLGTRAYGFGVVLPNTDDASRRLLHNEHTTHAGDTQPAYVYADGSINQLTLSVPKAARIGAGVDITDIVFIGQNLSSSDVTRISAGRDITATSRVLQVPTATGSTTLPVLQGNSIVLGGPGALYVEAGRDLGPFLNSATVRPGSSNLDYAGGILTVGNDYNPWLGSAGAKIYAMFGVSGGSDFDALRNYYVDPAVYADPDKAAALNGDLFVQVTDAEGNETADRSKPIYGTALVAWLVENQPDAITAAFGAPITITTADVQPLFDSLDAATQAQFLIDLPYLPTGGINTAPLVIDRSVASAPVAVTDPDVVAAAVKNGTSTRISGSTLIGWLAQNAPAVLVDRYGVQTTNTAAAYAQFTALQPLVQRQFLLDKVYFTELAAASQPDGPSYLQYIRGYRAVELLFPASAGYTANDLSGASNGGSSVATGNLDLRLAALETVRGGDVTILGPGGRVLGGSVVATSAQAARRGQPVAGNNNLFMGNRQAANSTTAAARILSIPTGYEGVLTLRGGSVHGFTDGDFLLNQSRLFTLAGGDVVLWSSNGDLNAGQGAKTSANNPPVVVRFDPNAFGVVDQAGTVSGAGIAANKSASATTTSNIALIAPVGTVDAGDAGVRAGGSVFVAAAKVSNSDNFSSDGKTSGLPGGTTPVDSGAAASANASSAAAAQASEAANPTGANRGDRSRITVEVLGFEGELDPCQDPDNKNRTNCPAPSN